MKGAVSLRQVSKAYGSTTAVDAVSLEVPPGEFVTLLGPSGCGKTTLLRLIAGFEHPDAGAIAVSDADVTGVPAHKRPVNTVFQHYALFPHRTVAGNIAFGLEMRRLPRAAIATRVEQALELVRLDGFGPRRVTELSGGQKQRVALARALVLEPDVLLLDEPMAALDLKLRKEMQVELKNLQERLRITFVFVTHDQDEALVMADRIAVMHGGRIEQIDEPEALYERPRTRFVADFLGVSNLFLATPIAVSDGLAHLRTPAGLTFDAADDGGYVAGREVWVGLRSEKISLVDRGPNRLDGIIEDEIFLGDWTDWRVRAGGELLSVGEGNVLARGRARGHRVSLSFAPDSVLRLDAPDARAMNRRREAVALLLPCLLVLAGLFYLPQLFMLAVSLGRRSTYGTVLYGLGLANYWRALDPLYLDILWRSLVLALATTGACLLLAYPVAYWLGRVVGSRWRNVLLTLVILPFWTSFLVRLYAWMVLLRSEGVVNTALGHIGVHGLDLLYNDFAVLLGQVYGELPFMIVPLYVSIEKLDPTLLEAAADCGAGPLRRFLSIVLPQTTPGIVAGCVLVFIPSLGAYLAPDLLGGGKTAYIGNLIQSQFAVARDMPFGAALSFLLSLVVIGLLLLFRRPIAAAQSL